MKSKRMITRMCFIVLVMALFAGHVSAQADLNSINKFIDGWHLAAANADAKIFFGSMEENGIYIGTDATERWTKTEFVKFAKPYFDKGKAWDFKPFDRDVHVTNDGKIVWFSELLTTWMGKCRGSGVMIYTAEGWKITQYHLSVTVPNEIIKDFISLVEKSATQPTQKP